MTATTNRRALLGTIVAAAATPVMFTTAAATSLPDHAWPVLLADYRAKHAVWLANCCAEDDVAADLAAALADLRPKPERPAPIAFGDMTMGEWIAAEQTPERHAAQTVFDHDLTRWKAEEKEVRDRITAPARARYDAAYAGYADALNALSIHPVSSLDQLAQKIEIFNAEFEGAELPLEYLADVLADVRRLAGAA